MFAGTAGWVVWPYHAAAAAASFSPSRRGRRKISRERLDVITSRFVGAWLALLPIPPGLNG